MVLDVPDLTGFKVGSWPHFSSIAQALCCIFYTARKVTLLCCNKPHHCFRFISFIVSAILCAFTFHWKCWRVRGSWRRKSYA